MKWLRTLSGGSWNYEGKRLQFELRERFTAEIFGFVSSFLTKLHTHSALARAMYTAIKQARVNDKFQDPLYLFLELVRAGVMHGNLWSGQAFSGGPSFGTGIMKFATPSRSNRVFFLVGWLR